MGDTDRDREVAVEGVWDEVMVGVVSEVGVVKVSAAARDGAGRTKQYSHVKFQIVLQELPYAIEPVCLS